MQLIKRRFRDMGSLVRSRAGDRPTTGDERLDNLRERLATVNRGPKTLTCDDLAAGLAADELFLEYLPTLDWRLGRITGAEALVRWQHPTCGIVPPDRFIALAEKGGLVRRLTDWVIASAATQAAQWHAANLALEVAVNISASDVEDVDLPDRVERHCRNAALDPAFLTLELPEPGPTCDVAQMTDIFTRLHLQGVRLSIEDFGRCYSSLIQREKVPLSEVKVDLAFVAQMLSDTDCRAIVEALIDLAHDLGLKSIAEGVEDDAALKTLIEMGCDRVQGHYISPPIAAGLIPPFVSEFESHTADDGRLDEPQICASADGGGRDAPSLDLDSPPETPRLAAAQ